ncbi:MAG TPA: glycosyltransferase family 2 protein [Gemmata sp.]|nr:glycosyltransferase family 2 protein [Gemmata sp.]
MIVFAWVCFGCAVVPAVLYLWNAFLFREPPVVTLDAGNSDTSPKRQRGESYPSLALRACVRTNLTKDNGTSPPLPAISVLIPARNEELGIAACVEAVLASRNVELEVIVLDDHSTDRTAELVREIATRDSRVRLESAPSLPEGWCGKQHACFVLAKLVQHDVLTFLDADVRLKPEALTRMRAFLDQSRADLVSGFPRQETGSFLEKLLIPLINWLLLCFLPLFAMRWFRWAAFGAGCGQWFMTTRTTYEKIGGHAAVKSSLHDGLMLPRAYRRGGFRTDLCDASHLATCRMYRSARGVWFGLAKNAREGMAATGQIGFWTVVLLCGQVLPLVFLAASFEIAPDTRWIFGVTAFASFATRFLLARRLDQSALGSVLHPLAIVLLLAVQWYAIGRAILGKPVGWKGRTNPTLKRKIKRIGRKKAQNAQK